MSYITLGSLNDLQIEIPTQRTENWAERVRDNFVIRIVEHDHTGNGKGRPLGANSFADGSINGTKFLLNNNEYLRSSGFTPSSIVNILRVTTAGEIEVPTLVSTAEVRDLTVENIIGKSTTVVVGTPFVFNASNVGGGVIHYSADSGNGQQAGILIFDDFANINRQFVGSIMGLTIALDGSANIVINATVQDTVFTISKVVL